MNRFSTWKYALIGLAIVVAFLYTLPNFFGESPAVQVSSARTTVKIDAGVLQRVEDEPAQRVLAPDFVTRGRPLLELARATEQPLPR